MIWEDEKPDHDLHAGTGILIALPVSLVMWSLIYWILNVIYDWIQQGPCS